MSAAPEAQPGAGRLTDAQRLDWLRLIRSETIGPRTFRGLVNRYGGAGAALRALPDLARSRGRPLKVCTPAEAEREMEAARRRGLRLIALGEPDYPPSLQAIDTAPPLIMARGEVASLARPMAAIVGSRNASAAGLRVADLVARELGRAGFVVVSGLARGIDARAHAAALDTGTVAVLAGGHDRVYPAENEPLLERLLERGAALSEMPLGWEPRGRDFPRRNRLVSGLSLGVVVVEAARRSGSLITARFALEQGREVLAVPGSPLDPRAEGPNELIRQGATLIGAPEHVIEALAPLAERGLAPSAAREEAGPPPAEPLWDEFDLADEAAPAPSGAVPPAASGAPAEAGDERARVLALLGPAPVPVDEIVRSAALPARSVQLVLFELELAGRLDRHGGNAVSLVPER